MWKTLRGARDGGGDVVSEVEDCPKACLGNIYIPSEIAVPVVDENEDGGR